MHRNHFCPTSFVILFTNRKSVVCVKESRHMSKKPLASIIVLTDGYTPFPPQALAQNIPALWLLSSKCVHPPRGKVARIKL